VPISDKPWGSISESDYKDADQFCKACLMDMNEPGKPKTKSACKLPVREPGGALNRNAVHAAAALAGARGGVDAPLAERTRSRRSLSNTVAPLFCARWVLNTLSVEWPGTGSVAANPTKQRAVRLSLAKSSVWRSESL